MESPLRLKWICWCLCSQGDIAEQEGDSQSQGSTAWLVDSKESKRTISTKYETTIFWAELSSSWPGLTLLPPPSSFCVPSWCDYRLSGLPLPHPLYPSPLLSPPPAITSVLIWKPYDLRQLTSSLLPAPCSTHVIATSWPDPPSSSCQASPFRPAYLSPLTHLVHFFSHCSLTIGFWW